MEEAQKETVEDTLKKATYTEHPQQIQVYKIIDDNNPSWHTIIYDLINSEQLDPWNIDITALCRGYIAKIREMQEKDFFVSSKALLAASLLLRIKSDLLVNKYLRDIDNLLFNKKDKTDKPIEKIEFNEDDIPYLSPKSPMARFKKVTLQELISALDVAMKTESRRIEKEIQKKQAERLSYVDIPKFKRINIKDRIRQFYAKIITSFKNKKGEIRLPYSHFTGNNKEEKIACFLPMLHLSNNNKLWLEQEKHFTEIYLYLFEKFKASFPEHDKELREPEASQLSDEDLKKMEELKEDFLEEVHEMKEEIDSEHEQRVQEINKDFENPIGNLIDNKV
jgi:segregation and condensation protein A